MPKKFIYSGFIGCVLSLVIFFLVTSLWMKILVGILLGISIMWLIFTSSAYYSFSPKGYNLQEKIDAELVNNLKWDGKGTCLDIGCGNAPISIKIAKKYPEAKIIATDYWGETFFEYDEKQCRINAELENVLLQLEFRNANAAHLPFEDESMDAIVSNLVFHEIKEFKNKEKHKGLLEALRVLKKGGAFAFQDVFGMSSIFGDLNNLKEILENHVSEIYWINTFENLKLPKWLNNFMMLQGIGIFYGIK